jgi:NAD(P)-dependent dehydrogenase (short-subunit alcohol dehydrogenase family)
LGGSGKPGRLAGRKVLITGAAHGIGLATAELFAAEGAALALLDRDEAALRAAAERLGVFGAKCDVMSAGEVERGVADAETAMGGLDGVVNAAGILRRARFEDVRQEDWRVVLGVNLGGVMLVCKAAIPALRRSGKATIVNIASIGGLKPAPECSVYNVSKAGVLMLSKCLAVELGPTIRVNTVCPGPVDTDMMAEMLGDAATHARLKAASAVDRIGRAEEIAPALLHLTSHESSFTSGANLVVDGGYVYP